MGQYWQVINLDKRQTLGFWGKLAEFIWASEPHTLAWRLIPVDFSPIIASSIARRKTPSGLTIAQLLGSLHLPTEILAMIFSEIDSFQDAFSLAYANTHLLAAGQGTLCALLRVKAAHWAGDRIVCIGDYAENEDLPEGMLTAAETQELLTFEAKEEYSSADEDDTPPDCHTDLYHFADDNYQHCGQSLRRYSIDYFEFVRKLLPSERKCYDDLVDANGKLLSDDVALCNLSRREYVRLKALKSVYGLPIDGPWLTGDRDDLGTVLLTRICWSSDASWDYNGRYLEKGLWAGDRFEIATVDAVNARIERGEAWMDASADALGDIRAILKDVYGPKGEPETDSEGDDTYLEGDETSSEETDSDADMEISEEDEGLLEGDEETTGDLETGNEA
ncbi:hypothetical protein BOTBODRAFT_189786 [Botryobasidium botryosum FD-172 SS1]|uniref:Uncharacterized protein n=1 Tax=Botryobasidium botryosum (strain FD-172 SS1) TaxID=930990 RepID=A0A067M7Q9_BOTB1|nr:hypothetical protein BOTBODRAFT_189786 [Botryobasidium botryosum FD-172 SS1]